MKHSFLTRTQKGFTLIELMIVVAIIGILAGVAGPYLWTYWLRSYLAEVIVQLRTVAVNIDERHLFGEGDGDVCFFEKDSQGNKVTSIDFTGKTDIFILDKITVSEGTEGALCDVRVDMKPANYPYYCKEGESSCAYVAKLFSSKEEIQQGPNHKYWRDALAVAPTNGTMFALLDKLISPVAAQNGRSWAIYHEKVAPSYQLP